MFDFRYYIVADGLIVAENVPIDYAACFVKAVLEKKLDTRVELREMKRSE